MGIEGFESLVSDIFILMRLQCIYCTNFFERSASETNRSKQYKFTVCSNKCLGLQKTKLQTFEVKCGFCNKSCIKKNSDKNKNKGGFFFCSKSCAASYNNTHKTKGIRVSKLEKWLAENLIKFYPNLQFHFNRKDAINSELDIYIPSLNLAFELNGIFHYEPIYGKEKLSQIQNNDNRKFQACLEQGIELCIVDTSSMKHFKESKAIKFLTIINNIINKKWMLMDLNQ